MVVVVIVVVVMFVSVSSGVYSIPANKVNHQIVKHCVFLEML